MGNQQSFSILLSPPPPSGDSNLGNLCIFTHFVQPRHTSQPATGKCQKLPPLLSPQMTNAVCGRVCGRVWPCALAIGLDWIEWDGWKHGVCRTAQHIFSISKRLGNVTLAHSHSRASSFFLQTTSNNTTAPCSVPHPHLPESQQHLPSSPLRKSLSHATPCHHFPLRQRQSSN